MAEDTNLSQQKKAEQIHEFKSAVRIQPIMWQHSNSEYKVYILPGTFSNEKCCIYKMMF